MKFFMFVFPLFFCTGFIQTQQSVLKVNIPTLEDEFTYVWQSINEIKFFESHGYSVNFPKSDIVVGMLEKARKNSLSEADFSNLKKNMLEIGFQQSDYLAGYKNLLKSLPQIEDALLVLRKSRFNWDFKLYENYNITLTLYGPGGYYNPETGCIVIFVATDGTFRGNSNSAHILIHDIIHMGIENSIVKLYKLTRIQKERIVDLFISIYFRDLFPDYQMQNLDNNGIDDYLKCKEDFVNLNEKIGLYLRVLKQHSRYNNPLSIPKNTGSL